MADKITVDFWFDPVCPWAWMTSRWIDEVAKYRDFDLTWHIMSLGLLNENREDVPERYKTFAQRSMQLGKVVAGVGQELGPEKVKELYDALGTRIHVEGRGSDDDTVLPEAVAEVGIPQEIVDRAAAGEFDAVYGASHEDGIGRVGEDVGTPVIAVDGVAFFGPVISPAPKGEEAVRLFDGVVMAASYDGFFELKRSRTRGPVFD
ncbi:DsbA family protein [Pseudoclavibacter chungangensis]|uniref:DsbA family protein n=1 Tax=Pseudoclavibacter chungangensis TaxID=587635 RepID=A0A7J5BRG3_9MICO|nr:DsbA family protein [Pseudoclavibacter chungangensis]KAB1656850.1 DsbA family protein [Pseudoclavibacter chungangensis]NYJ67313.1 protein-disulfide isomerase-like protein with CxxC motif [Pseudoclavibacter chungangensis]